jgi:hypothetical protein
MEKQSFKEILLAAGLRQADFVRLVARLSDQEPGESNPNAVVVNRWTTGRTAAPGLALAVVKIFLMLNGTARRSVMSGYSAKTVLEEITDRLMLNENVEFDKAMLVRFLRFNGFSAAEIDEHYDAAIIAARERFKVGVRRAL